MHQALQKKYNKSHSDAATDGDGTNTQPDSNPFAATEETKQNYQNPNSSQPNFYSAEQSQQKTSSQSINYNTTTTPSFLTRSEFNKSLEEKTQYVETYNAPKPSCRVTTDCFPASKKLQRNTRLPFSAVILPFSSVYPQESFPTVHQGIGNNLFRCQQCNGYINPFTKFLDEGRQYKCNLCNTISKTPDAHFVGLDPNTNERWDKNENIELFCGLYDIKAGSDYMARPPMPPSYIFLVDVSKDSVTSGMLDFFSSVLSDVVSNQKLPGGSRAQIAIFTYDSQLHYYLISPNMKSPQMIVVPNPEDFEGAPFPNDVFVNISENKAILQSLISSIPRMFGETKNNGSCLLSAIASVTSATKHMGGRFFILQASSSIINEPGMQISTEKDNQNQKQFYAPSTTETAKLTAQMHSNFICCYVFIFSSTFKNVITLGDIAKYTGGELYYYPDGKAERNHKFFYEFKNCLVKETTWEAVFRLRISAGWRISQRYGNYAVKSADLLSLPCVDEFKAMVYEFEMEDEVSMSEFFYLQSVLLYTTSTGERRLRVINYGVPLSESLKDIFLKIDAQALGVVMLRKQIFQLRKLQDLVSVRGDIIQQAKYIVKDMVSAFQITQPGAYIDSLATFPLMILSFLKHEVFTPVSVKASKEMDYSNYLRVKLNFLNIDETMLHFLPYLFSIHTMAEENAGFYAEDGNFVFPSLLSLTINNLKTDGIYLMDDGEHLYMLVGTEVSPDLLNNLFGTPQIAKIPKLTEDHLYHNSSDPVVEGVFKIISELRQRHAEKYAYIHIMKQGEGSLAEFEFYNKLVEDKMNHAQAYSVSYTEFSMMIHKGVGA